MRLINHLPPILQGVREYRALCDTVEAELACVRDGIETVRRNLVISTAEEEGLSRWEKELGLTKSGSDFDRRAAVLARKTELPYTFAKLESRLQTMVGEHGYALDFHGHTLRVLLSLEAKGAYDAVCDAIANLVPANIALSVSVKLTAHKELAELTHAFLADYTHEEIRNEVATSGGNNTEL